MRRRILPLLLTLSLTLTTGAWAVSFPDVAADAWYAEAVAEVTDAGLMNGTADGSFAPDGAVTRGMAAAVLWRLAGQPEAQGPTSFPDVRAEDYYVQAVAWAAQEGVVTGFADGTFGGDKTLTREQLAVLLLRYAQMEDGEVGSGKLDAYPDRDKVSTWAAEGVAHAVGLGLLTGREDGRLDPAGSATRAQLAVILQRLTTPAMG